MADEPVEARPPNAGYLVSMFVRRHRGPVIRVGLLGVALLGGVVGTAWGLFWAETARRAESVQRERTEDREGPMASDLRSPTALQAA